MLALAAALFSCGKNSSASGGGQSNKIDEINLEKNIKGKKIAVVYFSVNDQAEMVAEEIATEFNGDLHKIEPQVPYTEEDLYLNNPNSRINIEDDISLWGEEETTEETIEIAYGAFITAIINFILIALVLFCIIKAANKAKDAASKKEPEAEPTTKVCPYCLSEIPLAATRCPHCTSQLDK